MNNLRVSAVMLGIFVIVGCGQKNMQQSALDSPKPLEEEQTLASMDNVILESEDGTLAEIDSPSVVTPINVSDQLAQQDALTDVPLTLPTIKDIQQALSAAGMYHGKVDGIKGPKTNRAIKEFQAKNNLKVDGKVGPQTWRSLSTYLKKGSTVLEQTASADIVD